MSTPPPQGLRNPEQKETERVRKSQSMGNTMETGPSKYSMTEAHMNTERLWQHTQSLKKSTPDGIPVTRGQVETGPQL